VPAFNLGAQAAEWWKKYNVMLLNALLEIYSPVNYP